MSKRSGELLRQGSLPGLDYQFRDPELLNRALTHRSFGGTHNERLEFLGDGLLNLIVAETLYLAHPEAPEGDLSRLRARLVRESTLAEIAGEIGMGSHLRLGTGERKSGGSLRASILADALEAVIGAVYLDGGFGPARELVRRMFRTRLESLPDAESLKDPKTRLQEYLQARGLPLPDYSLVKTSGAEHDRKFRIACRTSLFDQPTEAEAGTRRKAEQAAAHRMLIRISQDSGKRGSGDP